MKKNVAIVWGGYSSEAVVSAKSMKGIQSFLDNGQYNVYPVEITRNRWSAETEEGIFDIDKNDFSFYNTKLAAKVKFDFAYITIHGTPGEDGHLQGYFEMLGVPYSSCNLMATALTFNKYICNNYLKNFGITVADSVHLREGDTYNAANIVQRLKLPLFVKPCIGGSSFATTKVKAESELDNAIETAFDEANEVIIESFISGTEVTCGCYKTKQKMVVLPLSEVITQNEFFDYEAKYEGKVEEITPARLPDSMAKKIQEITQFIYNLIGARGIIRIDYIISNDVPYMLEVNTTPGMTATSFIPQQVEAAGLNISEVLTEIIENEIN